MKLYLLYKEAIIGYCTGGIIRRVSETFTSVVTIITFVTTIDEMVVTKVIGNSILNFSQDIFHS
ncbi:MAG: hypothetical protein FH753_06555 [Firmicutes bacterium]|nr:hypothetical protein [Bacillota bacterium]